MTIKLFYGQAADPDPFHWSEQTDALTAAVLMSAVETNPALTALGWTWGNHREYEHLLVIRGGAGWGLFDFQAIVLPPTAIGATSCVAFYHQPGEFFHRPEHAPVRLVSRHSFLGTVAAALGFGMRPCPTCYPTLAPELRILPQPAGDAS